MGHVGAGVARAPTFGYASAEALAGKSSLHKKGWCLFLLVGAYSRQY